MSSHGYAYVHGFASSPSARKGTFLRERFVGKGIQLSLPDMNQPSFERLSLAAMLAHLDALHEDLQTHLSEPVTWRIVGSSLGGWVSARWAELHPERVDRLVLLCPAFDIPGRWPDILPEGDFDRWKRDGTIPVKDAAGVERPFHFGFYEEATNAPAFPEVRCPLVILHGTRDETVPITSSRRYVSGRSNAKLVEVDDGHDLLASLEILARIVTEHFEI